MRCTAHEDISLAARMTIARPYGHMRLQCPKACAVDGSLFRTYNNYYKGGIASKGALSGNESSSA